MSRAPRRAVLALATVAATGALGCQAAGEGSTRIELRAPATIVEGRDLVVRATRRGALSQHAVTYTVSVDHDVVFERADGSEITADLRIAASHLRPGVRTVAVKTGSERSTIRVRVLPRLVAVAAVALVGLILGVLYLTRRRRQRF